MNEETYIGSVMRYIRVKHQHSADEVAPILHIHPSELLEIEQGLTVPSLKQIRIFADWYRISIDVLFQRTAYIHTQQRSIPGNLQEALQEIRFQYRYHSLYEKLSSPFPTFLESLLPIFQVLLPSEEHRLVLHTGETDWSDVPYLAVTHPASSLLAAYIIPRNQKNIHCGIFSDWDQFSLRSQSSLSSLSKHAASRRASLHRASGEEKGTLHLQGHSFLSHTIETAYITSISYTSIPDSDRLLQDWNLLCSIWNVLDRDAFSQASNLSVHTRSPHQAG